MAHVSDFQGQFTTLYGHFRDIALTYSITNPRNPPKGVRMEQKENKRRLILRIKLSLPNKLEDDYGRRSKEVFVSNKRGTHFLDF